MQSHVDQFRGCANQYFNCPPIDDLFSAALGLEPLDGYRVGHSSPIGLELYSIEATQPIASSTISEVVASIRGAEEGPDRKRTAGVESTAGFEDCEFGRAFKTSKSPFHLPSVSDYDSRSPSVTTAISPSRDLGLADTVYQNCRIVRNNLPYDNWGRMTVMVPLRVRFVNFDVSQLAQGTPFTSFEMGQGRRILKITKSMEGNCIILAFSIGDISQTEPSSLPDTLEISLVSRRVNPKAFDNLKLNRSNYDESKDSWCEKYFVTISEFFGIINFIVGDSLSVHQTDELCPLDSKIRTSERKRIRSNIKKFLKDKTLAKALPSSVAENLLPSQKDFIVGMYNQVMSYTNRKPRTFHKSFSVLKFEDLQEAVMKSVSFFSFEVLLNS